MDLLYRILSQVEGCIKKIHYLLICLFCVWSNYPFFLKRRFGRKKIHPVTFRGQIKILHLFFADDIFLFSKAKIAECQNLKTILQNFCSCSGQIISTQKSRLWFSPNTARRTKELIAGIFYIPTTQISNQVMPDPNRYL